MHDHDAERWSARSRRSEALAKARAFCHCPCWVASSRLALCRASRRLPWRVRELLLLPFPRKGMPSANGSSRIGRSSGRPRRANNPARKLAMNTRAHSQPSCPPPNPICLACGKYHGSVGVELHCLRAALQAARAALKPHAEALLRMQPTTNAKRDAPSTSTSSSKGHAAHGNDLFGS